MTALNTTELVERLRKWACVEDGQIGAGEIKFPDLWEAATALESQAARIAELEEQVKVRTDAYAALWRASGQKAEPEFPSNLGQSNGTWP